jgi:hypothetical protein
MFAAAVDGLIGQLPTPDEAGAATWSDDQLRAGLAATQRLTSWAAAARAALTAEAERRELARTVGVADTAALLRSELGLSGRDAAREVGLAGACARVPDAAAALARGEITAGHVEALGRVAERHPELVASQASDLLAAAGQLDAGRFGRQVERWGRAHDAESALATYRSQRRDRRLATWIRPEDGMAAGSWATDPADGAVITAAIDRVAGELWRAEQQAPSDQPVPADVIENRQRRVDALVEICRRVQAHELGPSGHETTRVVVLMTLADLQASPGHRHGEAIIDGHGPVPVATARRLACEAGIVPAVLGESGEVLDLGRSRRLASAAQRRAARIEYSGCAFPGCTRPLSWTQLHHIRPWEAGGPTNHRNLIPLCHVHHHLVHEDGWTIAGSWPNLSVIPPDGGPPRPLQRRAPEDQPGTHRCRPAPEVDDSRSRETDPLGASERWSPPSAGRPAHARR